MIPAGYTRLVLRSMIGAAAAGLLAVGTAAAAAPKKVPENSNVTMFVHLVPMDQLKHLNCFKHGVTSAADVVVQGEVPTDPSQPKEYIAFLLIAGFDKEVGMTAVQFGIAYDPDQGSGIDVVGWQDCAALEWHAEDWPGAGTGNLLTWNQLEECQHEEPVVVGMLQLEVYGPDRLVIIPRPVDSKAMIAACTPKGAVSAPTAEFKPENLGWAGFGDKKGYNPWDPKQKQLRVKENESLGQKKD